MVNGAGRVPRVAVVGCSWFARAAHLPALRQLSEEGRVEVVALCSRTQSSLLEAQRVLGRELPTYTDYAELLANEQIDAVDLVLPTPLMDAAVRQALLAGKHVISEKPCAATVARCRELLAAYGALAGDRSWAVAENWPFKPAVVAIQNILKARTLGAIESIDFRYQSAGWGAGQSWRASAEYRGGFLLDSAVHFVSLLRLLGGGIAEVSAQVGWHAEAHVADRALAELVYENGARGRFAVDFTQPPSAQDPYQLVVKCTAGTLKANFTHSQLLLESGGKEQLFGVPDDPWVAGGVYPMLRHWCEALTKGVEASCTPMEGLKDVAVIEAMIESGRVGRPVAPAVLYSQLNGCGTQLQAYAGLSRFKPQHLVNATSVADVRTALREAASRGLKVRPMGVGNNWTRYAHTSGVAINVTALSGIQGIDRQRKTVRAAAGTRMADITRALAAQGLCLPSLPFLTDGTVGGMVATATHGTSPRWGTVSDAVVGMTLATASGDLLELDERSDSELMRAARVSVGLLGIVTEVELQAVDMKWARNVRIDISPEDFVRMQAVIFNQYEHVWVHWVLGKPQLIVQCLETSPVPQEGFTPYVQNDAGSWVLAYHHAVPLRPTADTVMLSMQYGVALPRLAEAFQAIGTSPFAAQHAGREIELKFLKQSPASMLGPNADADVVLFNTYWPTERAAVDHTFGDLERMLQALEGRPHWGKFHQAPRVADLARIYPQWSRFDAVRRQLDPAGMFALFE